MPLYMIWLLHDAIRRVDKNGWKIWAPLNLLHPTLKNPLWHSESVQNIALSKKNFFKLGSSRINEKYEFLMRLSKK